MNEPVLPAPPPIKWDPIRATNVGFISGDDEFVLVFRRNVFTDAENNTVNISVAPSAAVAMSWKLAEQIRDMLNTALDQKALPSAKPH